MTQRSGVPGEEGRGEMINEVKVGDIVIVHNMHSASYPDVPAIVTRVGWGGAIDATVFPNSQTPQLYNGIRREQVNDSVWYTPKKGSSASQQILDAP